MTLAPPTPVAGTLGRHDDRTWTVAGAPIVLRFPAGPVFLLDESDNGRYVLPMPEKADGRGRCWVLSSGEGPSWSITAPGEKITVTVDDDVLVTVHATTATLTAHRTRPHADVDGAEFTLDFPGAEPLAEAFAGFYWGTMLPSVVERTRAAGYPISDGYVISTLADKYVGTYPDVDHEFQIKGRIAWGSALDLDVVRRMIELQLKLMREDPAQLWRDPCAVQPDGDREYHVRRNSMDGTENANMFLVTGNVEVLESIWLYIARTKDLDWLRTHIEDIEGAASCVEDCIDPQGRLWSDVYYEDQVIKDGRETLASALAARSFELLAALSTTIGRDARAAHYTARAKQLFGALVQPLPTGYWDAGNARFTDWVDRSGRVHDHIHLLANILPVMFGAADEKQSAAVLALVERELDEFQRFPTFLAARIADYTDSEIGDGGPYDLCAAGRYWCWDAAFWSWRGNGGMLADQLGTVARQGAADDYVMGERYDMDHVYYVDGSPWHGAAHYYEYPCVYAWVLICEYLGVRPSLDADLRIAPRLTAHGTVTLGQAAYQLSYDFRPDSFTLRNLSGSERTFDLDLAALYPHATTLPATPVRIAAGAHLTVTIES
ncbi:glucosidase family protein [Catenuloplanes japonicus]|uniref:hypothetical protein n=1 Tax=Catenuloplanes japonicus TaxID=33876 RepID=UPI000690A0CE|nr:hypothetical protein [Catenuloplanes japonicus]